jgi:hypothetical protein
MSVKSNAVVPPHAGCAPAHPRHSKLGAFPTGGPGGLSSCYMHNAYRGIGVGVTYYVCAQRFMTGQLAFSVLCYRLAEGVAHGVLPDPNTLSLIGADGSPKQTPHGIQVTCPVHTFSSIRHWPAGWQC